MRPDLEILAPAGDGSKEFFYRLAIEPDSAISINARNRLARRAC
jgi:hypothetical protein